MFKALLAACALLLASASAEGLQDREASDFEEIIRGATAPMDSCEANCRRQYLFCLDQPGGTQGWCGVILDSCNRQCADPSADLFDQADVTLGFPHSASSPQNDFIDSELRRNLHWNWSRVAGADGSIQSFAGLCNYYGSTHGRHLRCEAVADWNGNRYFGGDVCTRPQRDTSRLVACHLIEEAP